MHGSQGSCSLVNQPVEYCKLALGFREKDENATKKLFNSPLIGILKKNSQNYSYSAIGAVNISISPLER